MCLHNCVVFLKMTDERIAIDSFPLFQQRKNEYVVNLSIALKDKCIVCVFRCLYRKKNC